MFEHILLAVDDSEHSKKAIPIAVEIAKGSGGEVVVFHVRERDVGRAGVDPAETSDAAADFVNEIVHDLHQGGVNARGDARSAPSGRAAPDIVDEAKSLGADLIVMGSRGRSEFSKLLLGGVANKVIQHAHCPVLVVR